MIASFRVPLDRARLGHADGRRGAVRAQKVSNFMKKVIIGVVAGLAVVLAIAGSVLGTLYFTGNFPGQKPAHAPEHSDAGAPAPAHSEPAGALMYLTLDPPFTMSFQDSSVAQYLQFTLDIAVQDKHAEEAIKKHGPAIRNGLVMLLSSQKPEELQTREGKEKLRAQIRDEIRGILKSLTGNATVEDVFFTSFVMQ
jgi:flagellar protein FliL